jgi:rubrerythrin
MATGVFELDRDIICPCDYRDPDVQEFGTCYCCLFVDEATHKKSGTQPITERRPMEKQLRSLDFSAEVIKQDKAIERGITYMEIKREFFYCKQCGYVVFREEPPYICPICRAKREFFAEIKISTSQD